MSSITNTNQNSSVVNVGRTTPVTPGPQTADKSIPVVMATDQTSIPVVEQNKVQSEVALSLLGIPRAEIALGIFADVNTYDVNPSEWSMKPEYHVAGGIEKQAIGIKHLPTEAGALVEASRNKTAVLTSKRFFRYQPGRVSAATFGVKSTVSLVDFCQNPPIRKFGIYDKYDGYYWESRNNGKGDNFSAVRRTQSLNYGPTSLYGIGGASGTPLRGENPGGTLLDTTQLDDYRIVGMGAEEGTESAGSFVSDRKILQEARYTLIDTVLNAVESAYSQPSSTNVRRYYDGTTVAVSSTDLGASDFYDNFATMFAKAVGWEGSTAIITGAQLKEKCKRDLDYWIDMFLLDLEYGGTAHTIWNTTNFALPTAGGNANTAWNSNPRIGVGVFPQISLFEAPIHAQLLATIEANSAGVFGTALSAAAETRLKALQTIVAEAFGEAGDPTDTNYTNTFTVPSLANANVDYGTRANKLDTIFAAKKNFWSYYVTAKKAERTVGTGTSALVAGRKYVIINDSSDVNWDDLDADDSGTYFTGRVFTATSETPTGANPGSVAEAIVYTAPNYGPSGTIDGADATQTTVGGQTALTPFRDLTATQIQELLRDKCQRDVGYVLDGYQNDIIGGGDAETTYNMNMFTRGTGLSVYSQKEADGTLSEPDRHTNLKDVLDKDLTVIDNILAEDISAERTALNALASRVIANFGKEDIKSITVGDRPFPGNLVVLRDGLIHTHGGVYDPSLLKDAEKIKTVLHANGTQSGTVASKVPTQFKLTKGNVTFGQHVRITWSGTATHLDIQPAQGSDVQVKVMKGEILKVKRVIGPKGNIFTATKADEGRMVVTAVNASGNYLVNNTANNAGIGTLYFETVCPFIFPLDYDILRQNTSGAENALLSEIDVTPDTLNSQANDPTTHNSHRVFRYINAANSGGTGATPKGAMFPYMYAFGDDLKAEGGLGTDYIGFINTALDPNGQAGANVNTIRSQIDNVNFFPEYVNWIKNNVKPEYWGVYEYRVPRSRFSHDALDGISGIATARTSYAADNLSRNRVYSDLATSPLDGTVARPGQIYSEVEGVKIKQDSVYGYDFTKVTMLKIEFSWYGAVGALFLAYVPVGNGEARWVRVHHLRASNQLKIASLGNATLPITYTTYGGGDSVSLGDSEDTANENQGYDKGYESSSHHIVKYGASYYIDGGDRGTVRLYSHNNDNPVTCRGKQFDVFSSGATTNTTSLSGDIASEGSNTPFLHINNTIDAEFFMGAVVDTGNALDQNVKVVWADNTNNKVYLSSTVNTANNSSLKLLPDRAETVYGIETKKVIRSTRDGNLVRNRVQVYPTKMSTANINTGTVRLRFKKTPIFQTSVAPNGTFTLNADYPVTSANAPLPSANTTYLPNGESSYGWFRGRIGTAGVTVFGRLYRENDSYYFEQLQSYEGSLTLFNGGSFLPDKKFLATGAEVSGGYTASSKTTIEKEGLSSVLIATDVVVPIPDTGINVATTYLQNGTEQFDLSPYFDYNKEYLSFPLTDITDSLYLAVDRDTASTTTNDISLGVTWEEQ